MRANLPWMGRGLYVPAKDSDIGGNRSEKDCYLNCYRSIINTSHEHGADRMRDAHNIRTQTSVYIDSSASEHHLIHAPLRLSLGSLPLRYGTLSQWPSKAFPVPLRGRRSLPYRYIHAFFAPPHSRHSPHRLLPPRLECNARGSPTQSCA